MTVSRHLVLVHQPGAQDPRDFEAIAVRVTDMAPDIGVFVVNNKAAQSVTRRKIAACPTFTFSPGRLAQFAPPRGPAFAGRPIPKIEQIARFQAAGLPVPPSVVLMPDTVLDPAVFGPLVIVKPAALFSSEGRGVSILRREDVRYRAPDEFPEGHEGRRGPMLAQAFVRTGPTMAHMRVLTLFGTAIYSNRQISIHPLPDVDAPDDVLAQADLRPRRGERHCEMVTEPDALALAARVYEAFADIPLQGVDLIRCAETGQLYVLEINPGGNTWIFSNQWADDARDDFGVRDVAALFDSWSICARVLVDKTRALAA
jgi:hypothetical protein